MRSAEVPRVALAVMTVSAGDRGYKRVALVHDFLLDLRGAERVFLAIAENFPNADLFSPVYNREGTEGRFEKRGVEVSALNRLRPSSSTFRTLLPFYPRATESLDLRGYDLIISSSSAWAHGVIAEEGQRHLCYCHNPFRYAWDQREEAIRGRGPLTGRALELVFERWRGWDRRVAQEVDRYVANASITRERVARCFGRSSAIVFPPVAIDRFEPGNPGESLVVLSELMAHKRIDLAVRACTELGRPLTVIGDGPDLERLKALAGGTIEFTGRISDEEVAQRLAAASGLVQCATEEFGIASVEAQAAGRPVLALAEGGALETVRPGYTGELFDSPDLKTVTEAIGRFDPGRYSPSDCRKQAEQFSPAAFAEAIDEQIVAMSAGPWAPRTRAALRGRSA